MANGNPFYIEPMNLQGLGMLGQAAIKKNQQQQQQQANFAKQQEAQAALESGDPFQISQFMVANPQMAQGVQNAFAFRSGETQQNAIDTSLRVLQGGDIDGALRDRAAFVSRMGGDPSDSLALIGNPEEAKRVATLTLAANMNPSQIKAMQDTGAIPSMREQAEKKAKIDAARIKADLEQEKNTFERSKKLRDEYTKASGEFLKVRDAYGRVQASIEDPDAAGDIALIFNYMKMLDPGSVVREGEFATAQNAGGVDKSIMNIYNKLRSGERLQPEQRRMFANRASKLFSKAESQNKKDRNKILGLGRRYKLSEQDIFGEAVDEQPRVVKWSDY